MLLNGQMPEDNKSPHTTNYNFFYYYLKFKYNH